MREVVMSLSFVLAMLSAFMVAHSLKNDNKAALQYAMNAIIWTMLSFWLYTNGLIIKATEACVK